MKVFKHCKNLLLALVVGAFALAAACSASNSKTLSTDGRNRAESPTPDIANSMQSGSLPDTRQMTTSESIELSKWVVLVKSISSEVRETPDKNIYTFSEFEVLESAKGEYPDKSLTLRIIGGSLGDIEVTSPLETKFVASRKYILFLGDKNSQGYPTIDPSSIFSIVVEPETKVEFVNPRPSLPLFNAKTGEAYQKKPAHVPLEDFLYSVRKIK